MTRFVAAIVVSAVVLTGSCAHAAQTTIGDNQFYTAGSFGAFNAPFGAAGMEWSRYINYADVTNIQTETFPAGSTIRFEWPDLDLGCNGSVCGFMALDYGDYDGTSVAVPVPSRRVSTIKVLTLAIDETFGANAKGSADGYDAIVDTFLTKEPGSASDHLSEIEVFLHCPRFAAEWAASQKSLGTFADGKGMGWIVSAAGSDILFVRANHSDLTKANLDLGAMLQFLVAKRQLTGSEYFNGLAIGTEPKYSTGAFIVNALVVKYE